jgi:hypothetical protein
VVVVLDTQRLSRLSQCGREVNCSRDPKTQRGSRRSPQRGRSNGDARKGEQRYAVIFAPA